MFIKRHLINLFFGLFLFFLSCGQSTEPDIHISSITETDEAGNFVGNIDTTDWSPSSYDNVYFGKNIWIYPNEIILFSPDSIGQILSKDISIFSFSDSKVDIYSSVSSPFSCVPETLTLDKNQLSKLSIKYLTNDSATHYGNLIIKSSDGDNYENIIQTTYKSEGGGDIVTSPLTYKILPAYPNPAIHVINFKFTIPKTDKVSLIIKDNSNNIIKKVLQDKVLSAGSHLVQWDFSTDNISSGFYRVIFKSGDFSESGDIKIIK